MAKPKANENKCCKWDKCINSGTHESCIQPEGSYVLGCPYFKKIKKVENAK